MIVKQSSSSKCNIFHMGQKKCISPTWEGYVKISVYTYRIRFINYSRWYEIKYKIGITLRQITLFDFCLSIIFNIILKEKYVKKFYFSNVNQHLFGGTLNWYKNEGSCHNVAKSLCIIKSEKIKAALRLKTAATYTDHHPKMCNHVC